MKYKIVETENGNKPFLYDELKDGVWFATVKHLTKKNIKSFVKNLKEPQGGMIGATFSKHGGYCVLTLKWQNNEVIQMLISKNVDLNPLLAKNDEMNKIRELFVRAQQTAAIETVADLLKFGNG